MVLHRMHIWHCLAMPIVHSSSGITCRLTQNPQLALSDNTNCALQVWYYLPDYTESTIGIVWQCQLCKSAITLGVTQIAYLALSDRLVKIKASDFPGQNQGPSLVYSTKSSLLIGWNTLLALIKDGYLHILLVHNWHCI